MSANTGVAPVIATALAVAAKVKDGTTTSSPGPMPAASSPRCSALVPELTATQVWPPTMAANSSSKAATSCPWTRRPLRSTCITAAVSSSPTWTRTALTRGVACSVMVTSLAQMARRTPRTTRR